MGMNLRVSEDQRQKNLISQLSSVSLLSKLHYSNASDVDNRKVSCREYVESLLCLNCMLSEEIENVVCKGLK